MITGDSYKKFYWFTPNQRRDMLIEEFLRTNKSDVNVTDEIQRIKNLGAAEQTRRKSLPLEFVECPYCKGYHDQFNNNDKLCEKCEWTVHILRWDIEHGIDKKKHQQNEHTEYETNL